MPIKILRLGFTESTLLFIYWMNNHKHINNAHLNNSKQGLIKWLYTTSGYYDKTKQGNFFNVSHTSGDTDTYVKYMDILFDFLKQADIYAIALHKLEEPNQEHIDEFKQTINPIVSTFISQDIVFDFIKDKKILIVSPFSKLMKLQIDNGNWKHIYPNAPTVKNSCVYTFPYTFFNNGPDNNILETSEYLFKDIVNSVEDDYESIIISGGAYSCLIAKHFYEMGKNVCTVGGDLPKFFGILNDRNKKRIQAGRSSELTNKEYWILDIPEEYKPEDYMKIENGCYW